jgi:hypothetical protein
MSSRAHRKALPLDPSGIHWGTGERHESGTAWDPDEWKRFETWAYENGAQDKGKGQWVEWCTPCGGWHREDGPAVVGADGYAAWFLNGRRHRPDGPAVVGADGYKAWILNGQRHRENGPARIWSDGREEWWLNDKWHREDGPARIWSNGREERWRNGRRRR